MINQTEQAFYEKRFLEDKREEALANMSVGERLEYDLARLQAAPTKSSLDSFPDVMARREAAKIAQAAPVEQIEAAPPPDIATLWSRFQEFEQEVTARLEEHEQRLAALEEEAEARRQPRHPFLDMKR